MARTCWPSDLGTPASCPGQADQTGSAGRCQKNLGPADRSFPKTTSGVSRLAGQAGPRPPTLRPTDPKLRKQGRSTIHILPADYSHPAADAHPRVEARRLSIRRRTDFGRCRTPVRSARAVCCLWVMSTMTHVLSTATETWFWPTLREVAQCWACRVVS